MGTQNTALSEITIAPNPSRWLLVVVIAGRRTACPQRPITRPEFSPVLSKIIFPARNPSHLNELNNLHIFGT
jgi:hypothetical protein